ncbi:MAG TPA: histidine kinase N-terminal 7TM domain-containing protein [Anaerolineaceae bacterium]|nr:histidine kinase N-terminal 7TM domain-containing protein [Anaerolineaceae bacterium]
MIESWQVVLLELLRTFNQILTAGISITAFSLLLYALTFNLRDRVARSFALILICVVIVFTADSFSATVSVPWEIELWLKIQWVGIILLPATYLQFSDAILATTGKVSRGRRRWAVRLSYFASGIFLLSLGFDSFVGSITTENTPAPHLEPTQLTLVFILYYLVLMVTSWINFYRAYRRTTNPTSRRRMVYLITGALAPALGSFPFLLFGSGYAAFHPLLFWIVAFLTNMLGGVLIVVMAYAVAFFGVPWPDRVVKARLFKWLMRGPLTASITLGLVTIVRRLGEGFGFSYTALVPIVMVGSVVLLEFLITLFAPLGERFLFDGNDHTELELLRTLEDRLLSKNDLSQFLEMILSAVCDRMQSPGAYILAINSEGLELVVKTGTVETLDTENQDEEIIHLLSNHNDADGIVKWKQDYLIPLVNEKTINKELLGLIGVTGVEGIRLEEEQTDALQILIHRASLALHDRQTQQQVVQSLLELSPQVDLIQRLRAASRYNPSNILVSGNPPETDTVQWVRDALTHYWGGPKLTDNPLLHLKVVQDAKLEHDGNDANALRAILREAIEKVKPEGERRFTSEWILYNILDMKFMEGRKVREIALRLAMSEADLYRKQRIAIETVAKIFVEMEVDAQNKDAKAEKVFPAEVN